MSQHVILVALIVDPDITDRAAAHAAVQAALPRPGTGGIEAWWVAEDDRRDGSDNDSAVFVNPGSQERAARVLRAAWLTEECNLVERPDSRFEDEDRSPWTGAGIEHLIDPHLTYSGRALLHEGLGSPTQSPYSEEI